MLFIDEAYSLGNEEKRDSFAKECIDTLCEALSDHKDQLMVIIAGYEDDLNKCFFSYNQGLDSRFTWRFNIDDYTYEELFLIFKKKVSESNWKLNDKIKDKWFEDKMDYFKFYGAENKLNAQIHEVFKDHCSHQMLPMELDGRLAERGLLHIKHVPFPIMVTRRDENSVARYAEAVIATFARNNGVNAEKVDTWRKQLEIAEKNGRFGFTTFPVLTIGYSK